MGIAREKAKPMIARPFQATGACSVLEDLSTYENMVDTLFRKKIETHKSSYICHFIFSIVQPAAMFVVPSKANGWFASIFNHIGIIR